MNLILINIVIYLEMARHLDPDFGGYGLKMKPFEDGDAFPVSKLRMNTNSNRTIFETLREKKELSYRLYSKLNAYLSDPDYLSAAVSAIEKKSDYVILLNFLTKLLKYLITFISKNALCGLPCEFEEPHVFESDILKSLAIKRIGKKCGICSQAIRDNIYSSKLHSPYKHDRIYEILIHTNTQFEVFFKQTVWKNWPKI